MSSDGTWKHVRVERLTQRAQVEAFLAGLAADDHAEAAAPLEHT